MPTMITILAATYVPLAFVTVRTKDVHGLLSATPLTVQSVLSRHEYQSRICIQLASEHTVQPI